MYGLYIYIADQIAQDAQPMRFKWAEQLGQSASNKKTHLRVSQDFETTNNARCFRLACSSFNSGVNVVRLQSAGEGISMHTVHSF